MQIQLISNSVKTQQITPAMGYKLSPQAPQTIARKNRALLLHPWGKPPKKEKGLKWLVAKLKQFLPQPKKKPWLHDPKQPSGW